MRYKTLGTHPVMTLAMAREAAVEFRRSLEAGEEQRSEGTLKHLCDYYLQELEKGGAKTVDEIRRVLYREVLAVLGESRLAKDIGPDDIRNVMHRCIERGAGALANRVRSYLMSAFKTGIKHDYDPRSLNKQTLFGLKSNPVDMVPRVGSFEKVGDRVLSIEELAEVWNYDGLVISKMHQAALKLIVLFGGLRSSEVTQAMCGWFDFTGMLYTLPPARSKNNRWHIVPLTEWSTEIVQELMSYNPGAEYLFPNKFRAGAPEHDTSLAHAVNRFVKETGMVPWTPRDLRRTCKTLMGYAGLGKEIRDRLQNHAQTDVSSKHYDRYLYLREKREALEIWEKFLKSMLFN